MSDEEYVFPAELLERYEPVRALGRGAMGVVFEARQRGLERPVALKVMRTELTDAADHARFARELRVLSRIAHPGVVRLLDGDLAGRAPFLAMELLPGRTLLQRLERGLLSEAEAVELLRGLLPALAHVHEHGLVHRDLKPSNIFLRDGGGPVLIDFGLARKHVAGTLLTEPGEVLGTPAYMSPEMVCGEAPTPSCDLFALALVALSAWTGGNIHRDMYSLRDICSSLTSGSYYSIVLRLVQDRGPLGRVLSRALMPAPADRFQSAPEMLAALDDRPRPTRKRRARPEAARSAGPAMVLACAVAALLIGLRSSPPPAPPAPSPSASVVPAPLPSARALESSAELARLAAANDDALLTAIDGWRKLRFDMRHREFVDRQLADGVKPEYSLDINLRAQRETFDHAVPPERRQALTRESESVMERWLAFVAAQPAGAWPAPVEERVLSSFWHAHHALSVERSPVAPRAAQLLAPNYLPSLPGWLAAGARAGCRYDEGDFAVAERELFAARESFLDLHRDALSRDLAVAGSWLALHDLLFRTGGVLPAERERVLRALTSALQPVGDRFPPLAGPVAALRSAVAQLEKRF